MAYSPPVPSDLKTRFAPKFDDVQPATILIHLDRAARMVDETWTEGDFAEARMLLAAHYMTMEGIGVANQTGNAAIEAGTFVKVRQEGDHKIEFAVPTAATAASVAQTDDRNPWGATVFGQQFWALLRVNQGGPMVAASPPAGMNHLARDGMIISCFRGGG